MRRTRSSCSSGRRGARSGARQRAYPHEQQERTPGAEHQDRARPAPRQLRFECRCRFESQRPALATGRKRAHAAIVGRGAACTRTGKQRLAGQVAIIDAHTDAGGASAGTTADQFVDTEQQVCHAGKPAVAHDRQKQHGDGASWRCVETTAQCGLAAALGKRDGCCEQRIGQQIVAGGQVCAGAHALDQRHRRDAWPLYGCGLDAIVRKQTAHLAHHDRQFAGSHDRGIAKTDEGVAPLLEFERIDVCRPFTRGDPRGRCKQAADPAQVQLEMIEAGIHGANPGVHQLLETSHAVAAFDRLHPVGGRPRQGQRKRQHQPGQWIA